MSKLANIAPVETAQRAYVKMATAISKHAKMTSHIVTQRCPETKQFVQVMYSSKSGDEKVAVTTFDGRPAKNGRNLVAIQTFKSPKAFGRAYGLRFN